MEDSLESHLWGENSHKRYRGHRLLSALSLLLCYPKFSSSTVAELGTSTPVAKEKSNLCKANKYTREKFSSLGGVSTHSSPMEESPIVKIAEGMVEGMAKGKNSFFRSGKRGTLTSLKIWGGYRIARQLPLLA